MKTALLLTNAAATQRLLTDILGEKTNFVLLPPPPDPSRQKFDALFATWLRLVDAVILDAVSLGEATRWAVESLSEAHLQERQAVVVRATAAQQARSPMPAGWLIVADTDSPEQLKQSLGAFFELRDAQVRLKRADAVIAHQRQADRAATVAPPPLNPPGGSSFDSNRYRDALKGISRVLSQHRDEQTLINEFMRLLREMLGVGKIAILTRRVDNAPIGGHAAAATGQFEVAASVGIAREVTEHLRLTLDAGIAGFLASQATILRRAQVSGPLALEYDAQTVREFEILGTDIVVPMFDNDQLLGVLTFGRRITGETLTNEDLELVYHLLAQLAQAIRNVHLADQVAAQQGLMSEVFANVQSGVLVVAQDGRILSLNSRARQLLELEPDEHVEQHLNILPGLVADVVSEVLKTGHEISQCEIVLPDSNRPLSVSITRFAANDNLVAVALIEDLTQFKLQQAQARELADKEFFSRLSSRMAHELKNSLVSIKIFAQLLPERYTEKEFREQFSTTVTNEVNRVDVLVNNLTFFGQPLALVYEELVLSELIDTCLSNVAREFARKQVAYLLNAGEKGPGTSGAPVIRVQKNFAHKPPQLEADKIRLMQAFEHIVRNAVQSMPSGGRLTINTSDAPGGAVRIEWQDTGEGISPENLKRVTEPFITTRNVGVGLGLTIVKKIIERHGGRLEIDSLPGRGTTIVTVVPAKAGRRSEGLLGAEQNDEGNRLVRAREKDRRRRS